MLDQSIANGEGASTPATTTNKTQPSNPTQTEIIIMTSPLNIKNTSDTGLTSVPLSAAANAAIGTTPNQTLGTGRSTAGDAPGAGASASRTTAALLHKAEEELREAFDTEDIPPRLPRADRALIEALGQEGITVAELRKLSPVAFKAGDPSRCEEVFDLLYPDNPLLCIGDSDGQWHTRTREHWRGHLDKYQFIDPTPESAPRSCLVIKFSSRKWDALNKKQRGGYGSEDHYYAAQQNQHAALLWHLNGRWPLAVVVPSEVSVAASSKQSALSVTQSGYPTTNGGSGGSNSGKPAPSRARTSQH